MQRLRSQLLIALVLAVLSIPTVTGIAHARKRVLSDGGASTSLPGRQSGAFSGEPDGHTAPPQSTAPRLGAGVAGGETQLMVGSKSLGQWFRWAGTVWKVRYLARH